jgi:uncharacterized membrane protein YfcA
MDFIIGFLIAVIIALTGVGAGVITAPLLILFLHVPVEIAVSTALAYSAIVKLIVVPVQVVRRQVDWKVLGFMLLGGVPGVVIGSLAFKQVAANGPRSALYLVLGAIILFTSGWHIYRRGGGLFFFRRGRAGNGGALGHDRSADSQGGWHRSRVWSGDCVGGNRRPHDRRPI